MGITRGVDERCRNFVVEMIACTAGHAMTRVAWNNNPKDTKHDDTYNESWSSYGHLRNPKPSLVPPPAALLVWTEVSDVPDGKGGIPRGTESE